MNIFESLLKQTLLEYQRSATQEEVDVIRAKEGIKFSTDNGHPTQRANTVATYRKMFMMFPTKFRENGLGLDYSAGLGVGSDTLRAEFDANIESYEIHPHVDAVGLTYSGENSLPNKKYDYIINSAVLNVLPQDIRDIVVTDIWEHLNYGGQAIIGVRSRADVLGTKTALVINHDTAEVIDRSRGSYQKGFTPVELSTYIQSLLPDAVVGKVTGLSQVAVIIYKEAYLKPTDEDAEEEDF